jgi:hypothetical protein
LRGRIPALGDKSKERVLEMEEVQQALVAYSLAPRSDVTFRGGSLEIGNYTIIVRFGAFCGSVHY